MNFDLWIESLEITGNRLTHPTKKRKHIFKPPQQKL